MCCAYIYLISFKDTNMGKTEYNYIFKRLAKHKADKLSSVYKHVQNKFNGDWSNVYIDVIDNIKMNEDLTLFLNHPLNTSTDTKYNFKKYSWWQYINDELLKHRLACTEFFIIIVIKMIRNIMFLMFRPLIIMAFVTFISF